MIDSRTVRDTELDKVLDMIRRSALSPEGQESVLEQGFVPVKDEEK